MAWGDLERQIYENARRGALTDCGLTDADGKLTKHEVSGDFIRALMLGLPYPEILPSSQDDEGVIAPIGQAYGEDVPEKAPNTYAHRRAPLPNTGLRLQNATIKGCINLGNINATGVALPRLELTNCDFHAYDITDQTAREWDYSSWMNINLQGTHIAGLSLKGSRLSYMLAEGAIFESALILSGVAPVEETSGITWLSDEKSETPDIAKAVGTTQGDHLAEFAAVEWPVQSVQMCLVNLTSAHVKGDLLAYGSRFFGNRYLLSLQMNSLRVDRDLILSEGMFKGGIYAPAMGISGNVELTSSVVVDNYGCGFDLSGSRIGGSVNLSHAKSFGRFDASECIIGGSLLLNLANIAETYSGAETVCLDGSNIQFDVKLMASKFQKSHVSLKYTDISNNLIVAGCTFHDAGFDAMGLRVRDDIRLESNEAPEASTFNFKGACCEALFDQSDSYGKAGLILEGFVYNRLHDHDWKETNDPVVEDQGRLEHSGRANKQATDIKQVVGFLTAKTLKTGQSFKRAQWIERSKDTIKASAYTQLHRVLTRQGLAKEAIDVRIGKIKDDFKNERHQARGLGKALAPFSWALHGLYDGLFGFGLKNSRAFMTLIMAFFMGWGLISWIDYRGALVIDQQAVASLANQDVMGAGMGENPISNLRCGAAISHSMYALDVFVPLIDLRQESKCEVGAAAIPNRPLGGIYQGVTIYPVGMPVVFFNELEIYRWLKVIYAMLGWVITSLAILTFSNVQRIRDGME